MSCRLVFLLSAQAMASTSIDPVYWNVENTRFPEQRRVHFEEKMDIYCPFMASTVPMEGQSKSVSSHHHYQKIYMVDQESYEQCKLKSNSKFVMTCNVPTQEKKFTIKFVQVNPLPNGFEFSEGAYYLISTSEGRSNAEDELNQKQAGVCRHHDMRMKLEVTKGLYSGVETRPSPTAERTNPDDCDSDDCDYFPYPRATSDDPQDGPVTEPHQNKSGTISVAIIVGVVFFVFIMVLLLIAFILFKRTSGKSKSSAFNPSTMSDYTIGKNGRYQDSYQDHAYPEPYPGQVTATGHICAPNQTQVTAAHLPHPFLGQPDQYGAKIVTLYPNGGHDINNSSAQIANDFTYRQAYAATKGASLGSNQERLSERTDATVLV